MEDTDHLLQRAESGDGRAVDELFAKHRDKLRRMVACRIDKRVAQRVDPSDVIQESLAEAANRLPAYLADRPIPFYPWLRQLAWERLVQTHRKHLHAKVRTVQSEQQWSARSNDESRLQLAQCLAGRFSSPSREAVKREEESRLQAAIDCLPTEDQELLVLRYVEQLSPQEAAAVIDIKPNTFSQRHVRVLKKLRQLLDVTEAS